MTTLQTSRETRIYLDHNATTAPLEELKQQVNVWLENWGNPSSIHAQGRGPKNLIREARSEISLALGVSPLEIIFTSGGTESNNLVIQGVYNSLSENEKKQAHFITTEVEHPSVIKTFKYLQSLGASVDFLKVSREGFLNLNELKEKIQTGKTKLVSVMYANNETGNIFPIQEITKIAHAHGALMHSDCVQALGKLSVDLKALNLDFASFSAHKFYALKGSGLLFAKKGAKYLPLLHGGGQERHRRGGTENTLGIFAFGLAIKKLNLLEQKMTKVKELRDYLEAEILKRISAVSVTGLGAPRLSNTTSLVLAGVDGETLLMSLDLKGFSVSTGAACSSGSPEPSPVLLSMGLSKEEAQGSLRVSLGWDNNKEQVDLFISTLEHVVAHLRAIARTANV